ncbi:MAG: PQQ-binding-like beta-propeller repeat protein [Xanthomonadaceae bacterium]|nr:PQQ-binding-like beta-propeller repeat protein [Xanthomonadaceae bacterium]
MTTVTHTTGGFIHHRGPVTATQGIAGSDWILASGYDSAISMFHRLSGEIRLLGYHDHLANSLAVIDDGSLAASCSSDYSIHIWDLKTGRRRHRLTGHADDAEAFAFIDRQRGVSASRDRNLRIWDLDTGQCLKVLEGHRKDVLSVACSDDLIYSCGDDMTLRCWSLENGENLATWGPFDTETDTCAVDIARRRLVLGCDDGIIRIFSMQTGDLLRTIEAHRSGIKKVAVCPKTGDLLSAAYDQQILIWDGNTLELKLGLANHPAKWERSFSWSPCGSRIYSGTFDGSIVCWQSKTGELERELGLAHETPGNPCLNEIETDGCGLMATASDDGVIRLYDLAKKSPVRAITPNRRVLMNAIALDADARRVYGGDHHGRLHRIGIADGIPNEQAAVEIGQGPINTVKVADAGRDRGLSFVGSYSGMISVVSPEGRVINQFRLHKNAVKSIALNAAESIGISCSADGILVVWDFDGRLQSQLQAHDAIINDVSISPDGKFVVSVSRDFSLKRYDLESRTLTDAFRLSEKSPKSVVCFDSRTALIGNYWGDVGRLSLDSGRLDWIKVAGNGISSLTSDGRSVYAASYDGGIYRIDPASMQSENIVQLMQQKVA